MEEAIRAAIVGHIPLEDLMYRALEFPGIDALDSEETIDFIRRLNEVFMMGVEVGSKATTSYYIEQARPSQGCPDHG